MAVTYYRAAEPHRCPLDSSLPPGSMALCNECSQAWLLRDSQIDGPYWARIPGETLLDAIAAGRVQP